MRTGSFRWWFEDRTTGRITIAQIPNPPLYVAAVGWLLGAIFDGFAGAAGQVVMVVALVVWGGDEILRGVNPWRRALGVVVLAWQMVRLIS